MNGSVITFAGTLGQDPELRFTPSGEPVANLSVAVSERKRNSQTGEWSDGPTTWQRVTVWGKPAEHLAESLTRGCRVLVTGTIRAREYADRTTGEKRLSWEVTADEVAVSLKFAPAFPKRAERTVAGADSEPDPWASDQASTGTNSQATA